mgnify:CR=1 FL=1
MEEEPVSFNMIQKLAESKEGFVSFLRIIGGLMEDEWLYAIVISLE